MELLASTDVLFKMVETLGSPLNIVLPERVEANHAAFVDVYSRHQLTGAIYVASESSQSTALLRQLASSEIGVGVASLGDAQYALSSGIAGSRLLATGPKTPEFLWLAARTGATVHLASLGELRLVARLAREFGFDPVPVVVRLGELDPDQAGGGSRPSRCGVPHAEFGDMLDALVAERETTRMVGVGLHLDTTSIEERANAAEQCVLALVHAQRRGLRPTRVDLGGGFGARYLADADQWHDNTTALRQAALGEPESMTWQGHAYGLQTGHRAAAGQLRLYPAGREDVGAACLDSLLRRRGPALGRPLAALLLKHLFQLNVEPGRALLDQCGMTLAKVVEIGRRGGHTTVRVEAGRDDLSLDTGGVLFDPITLTSAPNSGAEIVPGQALLLGGQCLEHDLITHRLVSFRNCPQPGDLLAFVNTAGHLTDVTATPAVREPTAATVAVTAGLGGQWQWCVDDQYWPTMGVGL